MVSIIENFAAIEGVIRSIRENPSLRNYLQVELELKKATDIDSFPNLAKADEGNTVWINIRHDQVPNNNIKPGDILACNVKKAFGQVYFIK